MLSTIYVKCQTPVMIGNGCGKSLAVYDEEVLTKLAKKVIDSSKIIGKVEKIEF